MNYSLQSITLKNGNHPFKLEFYNTKKVSVILRSLNHSLRQQIIKTLDDHKKMTVTELYEKMNLEQSVASQHLAIMRRAGIVKTERISKFIYYSPDYERIEAITNFINHLIHKNSLPAEKVSTVKQG